jgi:ribonuclease HI
MAKAAAQKSLDKWTKEKWTTSDGSPSKGKKRYLPKKAWEELTPAEKRATNAAKSKGDGGKKGKQFVPQPKKIAKKTARHR